MTSYWITQYKIDGFRFDFTKGFTNTPGDGGAYDASRIAILERMADAIWDVDSSAYVILEHFTDNSEETVLANYGMLLWGNLNYNYNEATMGWNSNSDFSWGYYGARGWSEPHLVTYMESHDEERLMFKNLQYGNGTSSYHVQDLSTALDRMKLAGAFFLTIPGPKMIWEFGERGYDISIDDESYGGRLGEKPPRWNYMQDEDRVRLYKTWQALLKLRKNYPLFHDKNTSVNQWLNSSTGKKRIGLSSSNMNAVIIGNFGVTTQDIDPSFPYSANWYDFFTGDTLVVTDTHAAITLGPGQFHIYTDHPVETPEPGLLDVHSEAPNVPTFFALEQNYPNPFNPDTRIDYSIPVSGKVKLTIYDLLGREVATLVNSKQDAGWHHIQWKGRNGAGEQVGSGVYFYRLENAGKTETKKLVLVR